jgi:hypothetical protein
VNLKAHASVPSAPTAPLEITPVSPTSIHVEWGAPESDGGAPLEGYKVAVRDAKRQMWMEVGRVDADVQRLKVQDLSEGNEYFVRYGLINIIVKDIFFKSKNGTDSRIFVNRVLN